MEGKTRERWRDLCAQAADEQDLHKLIVLVQQITDLLDAKEQHLNRQRATDPDPANPDERTQ